MGQNKLKRYLTTKGFQLMRHTPNRETPKLSLIPTSNMQPRRSSRLRQSLETQSSLPSPINPESSSRQRKYSRKRLRRPTPATPPPPEPEVESLSEDNTDDDESDASLEEAASDDSQDEQPDEFLSKGPRYEESRQEFQTLIQANPALLRPSRAPINSRFATVEATERYRDLKNRKFLVQYRLPLDEENLQDVKKVIVDSRLIYTVIDSDPFKPSVIRQFIANLVDAEPREDGVAVYVKGSLVNFSPSLINSLYLIPSCEEDPDWSTYNMDRVCTFLTNKQIRRWEDMSSKFLTATNQVLYKLVCANWIPTTSYTAMNPERLRFIYMLYHDRKFDFGKLVYNQIMAMAENTRTERTRRIIFPNLIQQVLLFQRNVPPDSDDEEFTGMPKKVVKDKKAGLGSGTESRSPNLEEDIEHAIAGLKAISMRLRRGEYPHQQQNEDSDGGSD
ncbi:uncharacterized protein LOC125610024 [Brassica napus]|uniref:uncharacterized protein LOC125610024 n=1 Tax=Brassica napus TaxID=3708 RepID=UPI00207867A6|nr:uncharacterized protein LOC125610024 [Brassica napus]